MGTEAVGVGGRAAEGLGVGPVGTPGRGGRRAGFQAVFQIKTSLLLGEARGPKEEED